MNNADNNDNTSDEYDPTLVRKGTYVIRPETMRPKAHKWLSKLQEEGLPKHD